MLSLTRRSNESLVIGTESDALGVINVKVLSIVGNRVKLGLTLNDSIGVYRAEVWQRIRGDSLMHNAPRNTP